MESVSVHLGGLGRLARLLSSSQPRSAPSIAQDTEFASSTEPAIVLMDSEATIAHWRWLVQISAHTMVFAETESVRVHLATARTIARTRFTKHRQTHRLPAQRLVMGAFAQISVLVLECVLRASACVPMVTAELIAPSHCLVRQAKDSHAAVEDTVWKVLVDVHQAGVDLLVIKRSPLHPLTAPSLRSAQVMEHAIMVPATV